MTPTERRRMNHALRLGDIVRQRCRVAELELRSCAPWQVKQIEKWAARFEKMSSRLAVLDAIAGIK